VAVFSAKHIIEILRLEPLTVEGGYFRETYRSTLTVPADVLPHDYGGVRNVATAIYYLLTPESVSAIHRVKSDEVFHFYAGDPVEMLHLGPDGAARRVVIGNDLAAGQEPQVVVAAGVWQGCRLVPGGRWALLGCTVAPGFDYADFELARREDMLALSTEYSALVTSLTKP
jgi:predicted cupin superfamily sugar epimerase